MPDRITDPPTAEHVEETERLAGELLRDNSFNADRLRLSQDFPTMVREGITALKAENDALRAEVARLTEERDAILRWSIRHAGYIGTRGRGGWWANGDHGRVFADTAEEVVRKAAGLDPEGGQS